MDFNYHDDRLKLSLFEAHEIQVGTSEARFERVYISQARLNKKDESAQHANQTIRFVNANM